jgi:hypothetical protein
MAFAERAVVVVRPDVVNPLNLRSKPDGAGESDHTLQFDVDPRLE